MRSPDTSAYTAIPFHHHPASIHYYRSRQRPSVLHDATTATPPALPRWLPAALFTYHLPCRSMLYLGYLRAYSPFAADIKPSCSTGGGNIVVVVCRTTVC